MECESASRAVRSGEGELEGRNVGRNDLCDCWSADWLARTPDGMNAQSWHSCCRVAQHGTREEKPHGELPARGSAP
jgi:hypothetical protein